MLPEHFRILYLHGFASSPCSQKACYFAAELGNLGFSVEIPDLAEGDFERLTISRQLKLVERLAASQSIILIGSSLGGYLAALYAARHPEVDRLILLAPAFQFYTLWAGQMKQEDLLLWRERGSMPVYHYGEQREVPIGYGLLEDASRFEAFPDFKQPALIFHGTQDTVVPVAQTVAFVRTHPNTRLVQLSSGHELTDVFDVIWSESKPFLLDSRTVSHSVEQEQAC